MPTQQCSCRILGRPYLRVVNDSPLILPQLSIRKSAVVHCFKMCRVDGQCRRIIKDASRKIFPFAMAESAVVVEICFSRQEPDCFREVADRGREISTAVVRNASIIKSVPGGKQQARTGSALHAHLPAFDHIATTIESHGRILWIKMQCLRVIAHSFRESLQLVQGKTPVEQSLET